MKIKDEKQLAKALTELIKGGFIELKPMDADVGFKLTKKGVRAVKKMNVKNMDV
jgi:predicted transcriptional regulator